MANLSQQKRQRMLDFLNTIRDSHKNNDEDLAAINEIETELTEKKFGLVFERHEEEVDRQAVDNIPIFSEDASKELTLNDGKYNFVIEGDNLHSLILLEKCLREKIDVIYVDPPYNTGAKSWRYNNDYVDSNDTFKHSKWLSFIDRRMRIAKKLLKPTGILVFTIDDYELQNALLLLNEIFGEENHLATMVIKNNPSGRSTLTGASISHEYALFYGASSEVKLGRLPRNEKQIARYKLSDEIGQFEWVNFRKHGGYKEDAPTMYYPIYVRKDGSDFRIPKLQWNSEKGEYDILEEPLENEFVSYPLDETGRARRWKWSLERALTDTNDMCVRLDRDKKPAVYIKSRMKDEGMLPLTVWDNKLYSSTEYGTNLLAKIIGKGQFDYPKSLYAVMDCLRVANAHSSSIVLDFFAGSGTTGHAVMELNKEDGGSRRFILCSNNENNICEEVTYERVRTISTGVRSDNSKYSDGIPSNLKFYRTGFIPKEKDNIADDLLDHINEMIQLEYGVKVDGDKYVTVLSDEDADELEKNWEKMPYIKAVFVSRRVLLTGTQSELFRTKNLCIIPDYYFRNELKEAGEA